MALYILSVAKTQLVNITGKDIHTYSSIGCIVKLITIETTNFKPEQGVYYIINEKDKEIYLNKGVDISKLIIQGETGIGRRGVEVTSLFLLRDKRVRVMPTGE